MAILKIVTDDHPTLRKQAHKIKQFDPSLFRVLIHPEPSTDNLR